DSSPRSEICRPFAVGSINGYDHLGGAHHPEGNRDVVKRHLTSVKEIESVEGQIDGRTSFRHHDLCEIGIRMIVPIRVEGFDSRNRQPSPARRAGEYLSTAKHRSLEVGNITQLIDGRDIHRAIAGEW